MQSTSELLTHEQSDPSLQRSFQGHKDTITQVIFNPNLRQLISSSTDGMIMTWGLRPNSRPQKFLGHKGTVYDVSVNPSGTLLASASKDNTVRLWNNNAEANCHILKGHSAPVKSIQFNCDGSLLLSASDDKTIKIWSVAEKKFSQTLKGHTNWVRKACFSYDSRLIASASDDKTVKLWDVNQSGELIHTFTDHTGMVSDTKFHPDGTCLASCGSDKKIKIFDVRSHRLLQHYDAHSDLINSIAFHPQGSYLISTSNDGTIKIWDLRKGHILYTLYGHEGATSSASFSPQGDYFATGGKDSVVMLWKSNLNPVQVENLNCTTSKIQTEVYVTDKKDVNKLPSNQENNQKLLNKQKQKISSPSKQALIKKEIVIKSQKLKEAEESKQQVLQLGAAYKQLKPEVKTTLDKIVYQVELVSKTLQLLEQRVAYGEDRMREVQEFIKNKDLNFVSDTLILTNELIQRPQLSTSVIHHQNFNNNQSIQGLGSQMQQMYIHDENPIEIAEQLKLNTGGEEFFRQTNVFASNSLINKDHVADQTVIGSIKCRIHSRPNRQDWCKSNFEIAKIDMFLVKNYGFKVAQQLKLECPKKKELMRAIVVKELNKTYKYPEAVSCIHKNNYYQAFAALDFKGKGFVEAQDITDSKIMYKLPFSKEEVKVFLETDTILKKVPKLKIEMFANFFYPNKISEQKTNYDFSDSEEEEQIGGSSKKDTDLSTIDNTSLMSTTRNREITNQIKQIEQVLKERMSNNWVSVRKAFLDLDEDYDGFLTPEDFAKLMGGSSGSSRFDFNLVKMLIKMRNRNKNSKINYAEFSQWFGQVIEPAEAFYFRHDSQKNPQYEKNMQKTVIQYAGQQKKIRELISNQNLKDRFIEKVRLQFKTTKKAFSELSKAKDGFIYYEQLHQLVRNWGFETQEDQIKDLFAWLDFDSDGKISYEDLRSTAGKEISPMEQLFFRQDVKPAKSVNCKFEKCWENNNSNSKSAYCTMHQKVLRNTCLDRFAQIAQQVDDGKWEALTNEIISHNYQMTIKEFSNYLIVYTGKALKSIEKEHLWETFKTKQYIEDNPDNIDDRVVALQAFLNARKQTRMRKINELISMEVDEEQAVEDIKLKGLLQVDDSYVFKIAITKKAQWGGIWKSIKKIDKDSNGYVTAEELEEIFREWFPVELDGKSLARFFKKFCSIQNRALIHYKQIKDEMNARIMNYDKQESLISRSLKDLKHEDSPTHQIKNNRDKTPQPRKIQCRDDNDEEDDELQINIKGYTPNGATPLASNRASLYGGFQASMRDDRVIIKKKKLGSVGNRSITPVMRKHSVAETTKLPTQNLMVRNTSIQRLNNLTTIDDQHDDTIALLVNNRNTTPVMQRSYQQNEITRNVSALKSTAFLSEFSKSSGQKQNKFNDEIRNKLAYEWKNIFRGVSQLDTTRKGTININQFNKIVHQFKVYLSREELRKIEISYGGQQTSMGIDIDYIKLSQELGLHKGSLDYIRTKSQRFLEQMTRAKDLDTKSSLTQRLNYIQQNQSSFNENEMINSSQKSNSSKVKAAKEFLSNMDKTKSGLVPAATFNKIARIFGLSANQINQNEIGMVDYERSLQEIM